MKNIKLTIKIFVPILIITSLVAFRVLFYQQNSGQEILGKYSSTEDANWVWEFRSDGKLYDYYEEKLKDVYFFSIETTSPQCGVKVDVGPLFKYLSLKNVKGDKEENCYEIYSLDNESLQIMYFNSSGFMSFKKSK
ncbi:hypothetical protein [Pararhodonellum marinum]|uniref:hypothetical protein n=1 Tax=Pararhodonellum marinum TaxID=2755358 RepID=UPI00188F5CD5|nr:hypothetical protein [Pararhodonellum marinum]